MKKISVFILLTAMVLSVLPFAYSANYVRDNQFHWTCLGRGESLIGYTCGSTCCIVCQKNGYPNYPGSYCNGLPYCSCGGGNGTADLEPPILSVASPINNMISDKRGVQFALMTNEKASYYYYDDLNDRAGDRKICSSCTEFDSTVSFSDGLHTVDIKAVDSHGNSDEETVTFMVDSKKPKIKKTLPKAKGYTNGTFVVQYDEENLEKVHLYYDQGQGYREVLKTNCPKGIKQECKIVVPGLANMPLRYYFMIEDKISQTQSKEVKDIGVDTSIPFMTIMKPSGGDYARSVEFDIDVDEEVTIEYMDFNARVPKWSKFCSRCDNYAGKKSFSKGTHTVDIRATDLAGNSMKGTVSFNVV